MRRQLLAIWILLGLAGPAWAQGATADPNSTSRLWIITLAVIGLVILFVGIASLLKRRTRQLRSVQGMPKTEAEAVGAVASLEKAREIASKAHDASDPPS